MNIRELAFNLQKVYEDMSRTFSQFQVKSGLSCPSGCGQCCTTPEIEATVLEMIPLALKFLDEGQALTWLKILEKNTQQMCLLFEASDDSGSGKCLTYHHRPALCRMFGAAGAYDKHHIVKLSLCKPLKEKHSAYNDFVKNENIPVMSEWYTKVMSLDPNLAMTKFPINQALKQALDKILFYAQYYEQEADF